MAFSRATDPEVATVIPTLDATADPGRIALTTQLAHRLRATGYLTHHDVACEVRDGVAYLRGRLHSHHLKQVAQAIAAEVDGIRTVDNKIEVVPIRPRSR